MAFVGLGKYICPFPLFDRQVQFFLATIRGTVRLPGPEQMEAETERELRTRCLDAAGRPEALLHAMRGRQQWEYNELLARMAGIAPLPPFVEALYKHVSSGRKENLMLYKDKNYRICDDEKFVEL